MIRLPLLAIASMLLVSPATAKQPLPVAKATKLTTTADHRLELRWWRVRHDHRLDQIKKAASGGKQPDVVFIGDSITQGWEQAGRGSWDEHLAPLNCLNLGFSGDRTEHVLWRLGLGDSGQAWHDDRADENNEIAGLTPKVFVVMIGSNNTGHRMDPPAATAAGITAIVDRLEELSPQSKVLLLGVFPRGGEPDHPMRKINAGINQLIAPLGEREKVEYLDISDAFLDDEGVITKEVMPDGLHPKKLGYKLWAEAMLPHLKRLLAE